MKLYAEEKNYKLYNGNMLDLLEIIDKESVDSIVCDPPYELNFMNKGWDNSGIAFNPETWKQCYAALKPGGYLLAFGGSRTYHRIACAIEDAGFEIRDTIMWLYGMGFPKSMNLANSLESKMLNGNGNKNQFKKLNGEKGTPTSYCSFSKKNIEQGFRKKDYAEQDYETTIKVDYKTDIALKYQGWGTALKPAFEPIIVARKPFKGSCVDNVIKYGVGGINIDECRVGTTDKLQISTSIKSKYGGNSFHESKTLNNPNRTQNEQGRFPANVILTYDETDFDEVCGGFPDTKGGTYKKITRKRKGFALSGSKNNIQEANSPDNYGDSGSAARYFYCAKASKRDRDEGLDEFENKQVNDGRNTPIDNAFQRGETPRKNTHPTVKPTSLMQYLVRLVSPKGATILDPFMGSGSTGKAVMYENKDRNANYKFIGIELTDEYLPIAEARIKYASKEEEKQMNIFEVGDE